MNTCTLNRTPHDHVPHFEVQEKDCILRNASRQEAYKRYRDEYRAVYGVYPELDRINNPAVALCMDEIFWPQQISSNVCKKLAKAGFSFVKGSAKFGVALMGGCRFSDGMANLAEGFSEVVGQNPELFMEFSRRFKQAVEPYKFLYGLASIGFHIDFEALSPHKKIVNHLGYYYDAERGLYYEGTWENDELVYGMVFSLNTGKAVMGSMHNGSVSAGVLRTPDSIGFGSIEQDELNDPEGVMLLISKGLVFLGSFVSGTLDGMAIGVIVESGACKKQEYAAGYPKRGLNGFIGRQKGYMDTCKNTLNHLLGKFPKSQAAKR